jgi:hypothetical protein
MMNKLKIGMCVALLLSGCQKNAAIDSLNTYEASSEFNLSFWMEQASRHTMLWKHAVQICHAAKNETVNCTQVKHAALLTGKAWSAGFGPDEVVHGRH